MTGDIDGDVQIRFPLGCKVTISRDAESQFPNYAGDLGEIIGYRHGKMPKVKWLNRKTIDGWHPDLLERY